MYKNKTNIPPDFSENTSVTSHHQEEPKKEKKNFSPSSNADQEQTSELIQNWQHGLHFLNVNALIN